MPLPAQFTECRCLCGSLVARLAADGIELKCRRCKRVLIVPWRDVEGAPPIVAASGPERPRAPSGALERRPARRELVWSGSED